MADRLPDPTKRIYFDTRCPAKLHKSNCFFYCHGGICNFNGEEGVCIYDTPNYKLMPLKIWGSESDKLKIKRKVK